MWQSPGEWNISRTCRNSCWDVFLKEEDLLLLYPSCCLEDWCNLRRTMLARTTRYRWSSRKLDTAWVPDICSMVLPWMCAQLLQLCPTLNTTTDSIDRSAPGSSVHGIFLEEYWSGWPCLPPGDLSNPRMEPVSPALQADPLPLSHQGSPLSTLS